jgi:hypothetical protein
LVTVFISDRGDQYLPGCRASYEAHVPVEQVQSVTVVDDRDHQMGMAGAVRAAWNWAIQQSADYVFLVEEDFRFTEPVDLRHMVAILQDHPELAQMVLLRQPWSTEERQAGGLIALHPNDYTDRGSYVTHKRIFSLNPFIAPRRVLELGWPDGNEAGFTATCAAAGLSFALYGAKADSPRVTHVGAERAAGWRL